MPEQHAIGGRGGRTGGRAGIQASEGLGRGGRKPGRRLLCLRAKVSIASPVLVAVAPVLAASQEDVAVAHGGGHGGNRGRRYGGEGLRRLIPRAVDHGHV